MTTKKSGLRGKRVAVVLWAFHMVAARNKRVFTDVAL